jgi:hypothetical protein
VVAESELPQPLPDNFLWVFVVADKDTVAVSTGTHWDEKAVFLCEPLPGF